MLASQAVPVPSGPWAGADLSGCTKSIWRPGRWTVSHQSESLETNWNAPLCASRPVLASQGWDVSSDPESCAELSNCGSGLNSPDWFQPVRLWLQALGPVLASLAVASGPRARAGPLGCGFRPWSWCWPLDAVTLALGPGLVLASQAGDESSGCSASAGLPACGFRPRGLFRHLGLWL